MRFKSLLLSFVLLLGVACQTVAPTPILIGRLTDSNNELVQHYTDCSVRAVYVPTKEGCDPELLSTQVDELMVLSLDFISADPTQPHGYDIYLSTAQIYFRIDLTRGLGDYEFAEDLSLQFFMMQKAHSGRGLSNARFYLLWFTTAHSSKECFVFINNNQACPLTEERKLELLFALEEGAAAQDGLAGARLRRLIDNLEELEFIIDSIQ